MLDSLFYLYYIMVFITSVVHFFLSFKLKISLYSISNLAFTYGLIFLAMPGYFIANGELLSKQNPDFGVSMDTELFFIYLLLLPLLSAGIIFGQIISASKYYKIGIHNNINFNIKIILLLSLSYISVYLYWIPNIPLIKVISGIDISETSHSRLLATHAFAELNPPFLLRYWQNIAYFILPLILFFYITKKKSLPQSIKTHNLVALFLLIAFLHIMHTEKAPFINLLIGIVIIFYLLNHNRETTSKDKKSSLKISIYISIIILGSLSAMYTFFMGSDTNMLWDNITSRLTLNGASDYLQIMYYRDNGEPFWLSNIRIPIAGLVIDYEYINLSRQAIRDIYPVANADIAGSAGGMALTELYYSFGILSFLFYFIAVMIFSMLDRTFYNTIHKTTIGDTKYFLIALYAVFAIMFHQAPASSIWILFSISTIFSPPALLLLTISFVIIKINLRSST